MNRAVFLDRDGVINQAPVRHGHPFSPASIEEFKWVEGIHAVSRKIVSSGFDIFCITNQPDVGRGLQQLDVVEQFHQMVQDELPIEKIYACYHDGTSPCDCRKPEPGLLLQAAEEFELELTQSWLVGDRWKDIDAGNAAGCHTIFLDYGYDEHLRSPPNHVIGSVHEIADLICSP
ncbi:MAG: HAD-IIIA family hydrolase [Arenicellales bacterium]|nr:HAD-IIIA family hydrolase [Arenicellales bacterium]MDP6551712.1 HAD-IIIA family hydrolase [Arenicellales bacterium]MDP6791498.1 HAD-IIIA family hydrolase [Arenicellales bacterium]MDP6918135.1 HAD-IIIA family hydrolase [Arenicellales bacterium]